MSNLMILYDDTAQQNYCNNYILFNVAYVFYFIQTFQKWKKTKNKILFPFKRIFKTSKSLITNYYTLKYFKTHYKVQV